MIAIFLGFTFANLLLLGVVFSLGFFAIDAGEATRWYVFHISLGIAAGLLATLTHVVVYTYFMATAKWLAAATDKAGVEPERFALPAASLKKRALPVIMIPIVLTMLTMFAGAGGDPTLAPMWPSEVHLLLAAATLVVHAGAALLEHRLIRGQGRLMDDALALLNQGHADGVSASTSASQNRGDV